jgi:hypothetical protein
MPNHFILGENNPYEEVIIYQLIYLFNFHTCMYSIAVVVFYWSVVMVVVRSSVDTKVSRIKIEIDFGYCSHTIPVYVDSVLFDEVSNPCLKNA